MSAFNRFNILNDDADDSPSPRKTATAPQPPLPIETKTQKSGGPAARSGRYYARGGAPKPVEPPVEETQAAPVRFDRTEGRPGVSAGLMKRADRGRGRGEGRGRGRGASGNKDRHSRTAIVTSSPHALVFSDSDKQVNQGWGADTGRAELASDRQADADVAAESQTPAEGGADWGAGGEASWGAAGDATADVTAEGGAAAATGADGEQKAARAAPEEEKTITYDEYLKSKTNTLSDLVGAVESRRANEGAEEDLFKDAQVLLKPEEEYFNKPKSNRVKSQKEQKEKITIEIDGQFSEPPGGRGARGGRGRGAPRGRGGRGRGGRGGYGGYANGANGAPGVDVEDTSAFPTLDAPLRNKERTTRKPVKQDS
ncbi:hypothetical protein FRB99_008667 [Tulasnella sp. 403]|nr:hypothetical protein FRB99_008667 [Tulasnella sp. 403]